MTRMALALSSQSAKALVNPAGMCCAMTIGGASAGSGLNTASIACGPPVDAPMAMMPCRRRGQSNSTVDAGGGAAADATARASPNGAIPRIARTRCLRRTPSSPTEPGPAGLARTSIAPARNASIVTANPACQRADHDHRHRPVAHQRRRTSGRPSAASRCRESARPAPAQDLFPRDTTDRTHHPRLRCRPHLSANRQAAS